MYKLLEHPFIQSIKTDPADEECKSEIDRNKSRDHNHTLSHKTVVGVGRNNNKRLQLNFQNHKKNTGEITISNYDRVVSDVEKKGHQDKLILELQRDLDDKTFAIEIRLKAKKNSQTDSKATPVSDSEVNTQHFFPFDLSTPTQIDKLTGQSSKYNK